MENIFKQRTYKPNRFLLFLLTVLILCININAYKEGDVLYLQNLTDIPDSQLKLQKVARNYQDIVAYPFTKTVNLTNFGQNIPIKITDTEGKAGRAKYGSVFILNPKPNDTYVVYKNADSLLVRKK